MSRRRVGANGITGPSSALTSFLRDQGITTRPLNTWRRREQVQPENENEDENENENEADGQNDGAGPSRSSNAGPSTTTPARPRTSGYDSDNLDDEPEETPQKKTKKPTKAQLEKDKAKAKAAAAAKKRKRGNDDDDFDDEEDEDEYTAPAKAGGGAAKASGPPPPIGSFEFCAECKKKFTVTKYTVPKHPPPGYLCHACAKASGNDPFKKKAAAAPKKRKTAAEKRNVVNFEDNDVVQSLASVCIEIIGEHIDDVESLGSSSNLNNNIAKIICKNRKLTPEKAQLFYNVTNTDLVLMDATALAPPALKTLASLNPNLERLRLDLCGRMDTAVTKHFATQLSHLTRIELFGPFLVRPEGWLAFFDAIGAQLQGFLVTQSPRFDRACLDALVERAADTLTELRLAEIGQMTDDWLPVVGAKLTKLTYLDLSFPSSGPLTEDPVIALLSEIGEGLVHLDLSGHDQLGDRVLAEGVAPNCVDLKTLVLANVGGPLTDEGVAASLAAWKTREPLVRVDLTRNPELASDALEALLGHSGGGLVELSVNGWKETVEETLMRAPERLPRLVSLDVGWCRAVDDFVIKRFLDKCPDLKTVKCFGCSRVTENCPKRRGVAIYGVEAHIAT